MAVPLDDYRVRIQAMCLDSLTGSTMSPDRSVGNSLPNWWVVSYGRIPIPGKVNANTLNYTINFNVTLIFGNSDLGNKGTMIEIIGDSIATVLAYFEANNDLVTASQTKTNAISGYIPGTLRIECIGEIDLQTGDSTFKRAAQFTIQLQHREAANRRIV